MKLCSKKLRVYKAITNLEGRSMRPRVLVKTITSTTSRIAVREMLYHAHTY
jgi:hypothetical protein